MCTGARVGGGAGTQVRGTGVVELSPGDACEMGTHTGEMAIVPIAPAAKRRTAVLTPHVKPLRQRLASIMISGNTTAKNNDAAMTPTVMPTPLYFCGEAPSEPGLNPHTGALYSSSVILPG